MNLEQLTKSSQITEKQRGNFIANMIQCILDVNWPGLKADRLSQEHISEFVTYIRENYVFDIIETESATHIISNPIKKF